MNTQSNNAGVAISGYGRESLKGNEIDNVLKAFSRDDILNVFETLNQFKNFFKQNRLSNLDDLLTKIAVPASKKSFLVFKHKKYINIATEAIAFFYVRNETSTIVCYDGEEYAVDYSLEEVKNLLPEQNFFRINRQYLISFSAIKEVEHYFSRKLFVRLAIPAPGQLLVSKEKANVFLQWLEER
jgi:two-component system, LytTR family, response regulator LytT